MRLRPTAPIAADAVLVGDPGRALLLAQELLEEPKMSNHARGLWGYTGLTPAGGQLTIQATGMGGPSAAIVLTDLAELGLRRAVRVGTCVAIDPARGTGELLTVAEARAGGEAIPPDPELSVRLRRALGGDAATATIASVDRPPAESAGLPPGVEAADLQTATVLSRAPALGIAAAAVLIVEETASGERIAIAELEEAAKRGGIAAAQTFSG
jgi:purine-nucleoside phosphorylase